MSQPLLWLPPKCWWIPIVYLYLRPLFWTHVSNFLLNFCIKISHRHLELNLCLHNCFSCPMYIFILLLPVLSPSIQLFLPKPKINFWYISHIVTCNQSPSPVYSHSLIPSLLPKSKTPSSTSEYWNGFLTFFQLHSFIPLIHFPHGKPECSFKNINQIIWVSQLLLCYTAVINNTKFQWQQQRFIFTHMICHMQVSCFSDSHRFFFFYSKRS